MIFSTTANVECTIEQWSQIYYETHIACRLALIHSTCSSSLQSKLQITHANTPTALSLFKNVIFRYSEVQETPYRKNINFIETNQITLCRDLHPLKFNIDKPT